MYYISILRGINVGGKRKILMADLKAMYLDLSFENVQSYIQSGNIIFFSPQNYSAQHLEQLLSSTIKERFQLNVPVIVRTTIEIKETVDKNPFITSTEIEQLHLTFLNKAPHPTAIENLKDLIKKKGIQDELYIEDNNVFIRCNTTYSACKLSNTFLEKQLNTSATTRNWKTINKLIELSKKI